MTLFDKIRRAVARGLLDAQVARDRIRLRVQVERLRLEGERFRDQHGIALTRSSTGRGPTG